MPLQAAQANGTTLYLDDAVATGSRQLQPGERATLRRRGSWLVVGGCALLLPAPVLFLCVLGALAVVAAPDGAVSPASIALMVLMLVFVPLLLLFGHHSYRRGVLLRQDARGGEVYRFERADAGGSEPEAAWFEVLPHSRVVLRSENGRKPGTAMRPFVPVADTPGFAATAAEWTEPVLDAEGNPTHFNHRALSPAELGEVLRHARATAFTQLRVAIPLNLWVGIIVSLTLQAGQLPVGYRLWSFLVLLTVTVLVDISTILGVIDGRKLFQDHRTARVIILRTSQPDTELSPPSEYLPFSGRRWTVDGKPDHWRSRFST